MMYSHLLSLVLGFGPLESKIPTASQGALVSRPLGTLGVWREGHEIVLLGHLLGCKVPVRPSISLCGWFFLQLLIEILCFWGNFRKESKEP